MGRDLNSRPKRPKIEYLKKLNLVEWFSIWDGEVILLSYMGIYGQSKNLYSIFLDQIMVYSRKQSLNLAKY